MGFEDRVRASAVHGRASVSTSPIGGQDLAVLDPQALALEATLQQALHASGAPDQRLNLHPFLAGHIILQRSEGGVSSENPSRSVRISAMVKPACCATPTTASLSQDLAQHPAVVAPPSSLPPGLRQQPHTLVVAQCRRPHPRTLRHLTYLLPLLRCSWAFRLHPIPPLT